MKKTLFLSMAMAFVTFTAFAQENAAAAPHGQMQGKMTVEERAKRQTDRINATAQLSTDQYNKVLEINKNFAGQKDALRASGTQGEDLKAKFKALSEQQEAAVKAVLTADQYAKVQAARKEHQTAPRGE
jgi:protein CpxP